MKPTQTVVKLLLVVLAWSHPASATDRPGDNIALGSAYTLDPPPNYGLCTDAGDLKQLTDGQYTDGYIWVCGRGVAPDHPRTRGRR